MLPFFNMRFFRNGNLAILQPFIEKMNKGELTLENILEEDEIVQDIKTNPNSKFIDMLSNEAIRKLIDYATKMPKADDQKTGHKFPFNATEILCCDNASVVARIMNEIRMGDDNTDEEEDEKEEGEKENNEDYNTEDDKKKEENEEFFEVKEDENKEQEPKEIQDKEEKNETENEKQNSEQTQEKKLDNEKNEKEEAPKEEPPKEENKEVKAEEKQKEIEKQEEDKKEESKPEEIKDEKKEEPEQKTEEKKPEEKNTEEKKPEEAPKEGEVPQKSEEQQKVEEPKKEEEKLPEKNEKANKAEEKPKEEPQPEPELEPEQKPKEPEQKNEEQKEEQEKKEEPKKEEKQPQDEVSSPTENEKEEKKEEPETQKNEEESAEEPKHEEDNQKNEEENEREEEQEKEEGEQPKEVTIIYDNVDYLLSFLNEAEETKSNYVLVGYFIKILNHLINSQTSKLIQYLFDHPKKNEFDVLGLIIKNMKRKSMGELVSKLLLFQEDSIEEFLPKKFELLEKVLEELKETNEEDKYECICSTLESVFYNKSFFIEFMKEPKFLDLLYAILEKSLENPKKLSAVLRLLINVHENILKNEDERITIPVSQENPMDFLSMFNGAYGLEETNQKELNPEIQKFVDDANKNLIELLKKCNFNFISDLDDFSSKENSEFMSTYQIIQRKLGMKKLLQIEFFRSILDILVNAYAKFDEQEIKDSIINIINSAQEKKIFWKMHKLFFDFPFCNLYQSFYLQIFDIILNEHSPKELIEYTFIEKEGENEKNLIQIFIDKVINEMKFEFTSGRISFHPNYSFEVTILNKINASTNEYLKELIKDNKNLAAFDQILGQEIDTIFNQKLLLNVEKDIQIGQNIGLEKEEEAPLQYFGKKNFMELLEQDNSIYSVYLKGEDYESLLNEKKEQEKLEKEERKKLEEKSINEGGEEEMVSGLGDSINIMGGNDVEEQEEAQKIEEGPDIVTEEEVSEETEEEKRFNDVNYWKADVKPDDNIMSAVLNDLD